MKMSVTVTAALLALPAVAVAQSMGGMGTEGAGPFATAMLQLLQRADRNMPAAAELMPAGKYSFKPTAKQMTFGAIMAHEARSNETLCAALAGGKATPSESAAGATAPKAELVTNIKQSFDACRGVVSKLTASELGDSVPFFGGRKATKAIVAAYLLSDWADHYAQAAMYLRLNGILPPTARHGM